MVYTDVAPPEDRHRTSGELSVSEARSRFPITGEWLKKLTRVQSIFPSFLGDNHLGFELAQKNFDHSTAKLLRDAATTMLSTFDYFIQKDKEVDEEQHLPHTNDFVEGAHGTYGMVNDRLSGANPMRIASIVQRKHNQKALQSLEVPLVPSPEEP